MYRICVWATLPELNKLDWIGLRIRCLRRFQSRLFSAPEIFIQDVYVTKRRRQMESIYGAGLWSVCHGYNETVFCIQYDTCTTVPGRWGAFTV